MAIEEEEVIEQQRKRRQPPTLREQARAPEGITAEGRPPTLRTLTTDRLVSRVAPEQALSPRMAGFPPEARAAALQDRERQERADQGDITALRPGDLRRLQAATGPSSLDTTRRALTERDRFGEHLRRMQQTPEDRLAEAEILGRAADTDRSRMIETLRDREGTRQFGVETQEAREDRLARFTTDLASVDASRSTGSGDKLVSLFGPGAVANADPQQIRSFVETIAPGAHSDLQNSGSKTFKDVEETAAGLTNFVSRGILERAEGHLPASLTDQDVEDLFIIAHALPETTVRGFFGTIGDKVGLGRGNAPAALSPAEAFDIVLSLVATEDVKAISATRGTAQGIEFKTGNLKGPAAKLFGRVAQIAEQHLLQEAIQAIEDGEPLPERGRQLMDTQAKAEIAEIDEQIRELTASKRQGAIGGGSGRTGGRTIRSKSERESIQRQINLLNKRREEISEERKDPESRLKRLRAEAQQQETDRFNEEIQETLSRPF